MSSYLKSDPSQVADFNSTEYDFKVFTTAISERQNKYDVNKEKINNYYNSLLNAELSRTDNQELRDQYVEGIQDKIKQLSSVDLSINANVAEASKIFTPFLEDKYIRSDMFVTSSAKKAHAEAQQLKNSTDKDKERGEYWSGGEELIDYELEQFKNSNREHTLSPNPIQYTPAVDVNALLLDKAKDYGFNVTKDFIGTTTADGMATSPNGEYIITTVNGDLVTEDCASSFFQMLNQEPAYQEYAKARAKLDRYRNTYSGGYDFQTVRDKTIKYKDKIYTKIQKDTRTYEETLGRIREDLKKVSNDSPYKVKLEGMRQHYEGLINSSNEHLGSLEFGGLYTENQLDEFNAKLITSEDAMTRAKAWTTMTESQKIEQNPVVANIYTEQQANYRELAQIAQQEKELFVRSEELKFKKSQDKFASMVQETQNQIEAYMEKIQPDKNGKKIVSKRELRTKFGDGEITKRLIEELSDYGDYKIKD